MIKKTTGELIDQLITADIRCWFAQEDIMNEDLSGELRLKAAILAQRTNARRTALIRAIDEKLNEPEVGFLKTYDE